MLLPKVASLTEYDFTGYWGEVYKVRFMHFDPRVKSQIFTMSGQFMVTEVITRTDVTTVGFDGTTCVVENYDPFNMITESGDNMVTESSDNMVTES